MNILSDLFLHITWGSVHSCVLLEETCLKPSQLEYLMELAQTISITFSGYSHICLIVLNMYGTKCVIFLDFAPVSNGKWAALDTGPDCCLQTIPRCPLILWAERESSHNCSCRPDSWHAPPIFPFAYYLVKMDGWGFWVTILPALVSKIHSKAPRRIWKSAFVPIPDINHQPCVDIVQI